MPFHIFLLHFKPCPHAVRIFFNGNTIAPLECMCSFTPVHTLRRSQRFSKICLSESNFENLNLFRRNYLKKSRWCGKSPGDEFVKTFVFSARKRSSRVEGRLKRRKKNISVKSRFQKFLCKSGQVLRDCPFYMCSSFPLDGFVRDLEFKGTDMNFIRTTTSQS